MRYFFTILICYLLSLTAMAHPHAFIDMKSQFLVEQGKLTGIRMQWLMDEISSSEVIYEIETSKNKQQKLAQLTNEIMQNIVGQHYFAYFYDDNHHPITYRKQPQNAKLTIINKRQLQINFDVILSKPRELNRQTATLLVYDPTYYIAMLYLTPKDVSFVGETSCHLAIIEPESNPTMKDYAASLDKNAEEDTSLGVLFAQKVTLSCP